MIFAVDAATLVDRSLALFDKLFTVVASSVTVFVSSCICCLIPTIIVNISIWNVTFTTSPFENSVSAGLRISSLRGDSSGRDNAGATPLIPERNSWNHGLFSYLLAKGDPWSSPPGWEAISVKEAGWGEVLWRWVATEVAMESLVLSVVQLFTVIGLF